LLAVQIRQVVANDGVLGIELEGLAIGGDRLLGPALAVVRVREIRLDDGRRRRRVGRLLELGDRFVELAVLQECRAARVLLGRRVGGLVLAPSGARQ
jgi:hypothetical protein